MSTPPSPPGVTVVVTCYNHQSYVEQCLDSVLDQTVSPSAVIVTDDASSDDSVAVIRDWMSRRAENWRLLTHEVNMGVCATLNQALASVTTPYYIHISADDWLHPERLALQSSVAAASPEAGFVVGDIREVDAGGATLAYHDIGVRLDGLVGGAGQPALFERLLAENIIPAPGVMVRTDAARAVGAYDESLSFEDYDLWLRLSRVYPVAYGAGEVSSYRVLRSSMSRSTHRIRTFRESEMAMLRKHVGGGGERDAVIAGRVAALEAQLAKELTAARRAKKTAASRSS